MSPHIDSPYANNEPYGDSNYYQEGYHSGGEPNDVHYNRGPNSDYHLNGYQNTSRPNRGRASLFRGNPLSIQNRFAPLQYPGPHRGGDFHRNMRGSGRGAPFIPPNPGGKPSTVPPPAQTTDNKEKEKSERKEKRQANSKD